MKIRLEGTSEEQRKLCKLILKNFEVDKMIKPFEENDKIWNENNVPEEDRIIVNYLEVTDKFAVKDSDVALPTLDVEQWEKHEANFQQAAEEERKDLSYLEPYKQSKFAETYRGYLLNLLTQASNYIGSKKAIEIFLDRVVTNAIHKSTLRNIIEVNKKLHALNANEIYDYLCEVGLDPNLHEGMLAYELEQEYSDIDLSVIMKMNSDPLISLENYVPDKRYYKLVNYYDPRQDASALFLETTIDSVEELICILSSLQFKFEDLISENISPEPTHLMAILQKYYDIKDVTDSFQTFLPHTQLPKDQWQTVKQFDIAVNEAMEVTITQIDLYFSREDSCGPHVDKMMDMYLPKDKSFDQDILKFKESYKLPF